MFVLKTYLTEHYEFRYNQVTGSICFRRKGEETFKNFDVRAENTLLVELEEKLHRSSDGKLYNLLRSDFSILFDPIREYLEGLTWDGEDHFDKLTNSITTDDDSFFRIAFKKYLISAIHCWLTEKGINEQILILAGKQNVGKSTLARNLTPTSMKEYLYQGSILQNKNDFLKHVSRKMFIILDEIDNVAGRDVPLLKELITREKVETRLAYQKNDINEQRRASFIGTTNVSQPLRDLSGSRRMLTFYIKDIIKDVKVDFDQLWAQIYSLYNAGEVCRFSENEIEYICKRNEKFTYRDMVAESILKYFELTDSPEFRLTNKQIAKEIMADVGHSKLSMPFLQKTGSILNQMGVTRKKSNGNVYYHIKKRDKQVDALLSTSLLTEQ